jgi:predicted ATPase
VLQVRIGISTGLVVVGELIGKGEALLRGLVGDTPDLAVRLQALAAPNTILVSDRTRRLLGGAFELNERAPQHIKDIPSEIAAWRIVRERKNVSRFEASRSEALTPFIGREREIAELLECWQRAAAGNGQLVQLSGEAGIGKSRVLAMLRDRVGQERHLSLRYQCSPHRANDTLHPVSGHLWHAAGFIAGEPTGARLDKLEQMIERIGLPPRDIAPLLASLLAIPTEQRYGPIEMAPSEIKERTLAALIALIVQLAKRTPLLVFLEDAHWIDPTTLELTNRLVDTIKQLPVLLVITFRPEFISPWSGKDYAHGILLNRFERDQSVAMVARMIPGKRLPAEVLDQIVAKTDGVPLFMEELTKNVLESGLLREENGAYILASELTPLAIPSTLHDSLMARLDRLSPVKEIAQIGAAIGRAFSHELLEVVSPVKGETLDAVLHQLIDAELIYRRGKAPRARYVFKHALVQDAAYGSLLRSRRQHIHARIAVALERRQTGEEYLPATIALHLTEAGLSARAASAWLAAAELALSQSAPVEAERHASSGLALIPGIVEGPGRDALKLSLLVARANALVPLKTISAPETFEALTAAKQLLDRGVGNDLQRVSVLFGLCSATTLRARLQPAIELARQIIEVAARQDDPTYRLVGYRMLGTSQYYAGQSREALTNLQRGKTYRDPRRQRAISYRFGWDPSLAILCFEVLVQLSLGKLDSAEKLSEQVRAEAMNHGHATTVASARFCAGTWPQAALGDLAGLERDSAALVSYCAEKKVEQIRLLATFHHAYARAMRRPGAANGRAQRAALNAVRAAGNFTGTSFFLCNLAEAGLAAGDLLSAEADLQDGFSFVAQSGERCWLAELHRLSGRIALKRPHPDPSRAERCFAEAIEVARHQEARLLELRAAHDLAQVWRDTGSNRDPRALLEPAIAGIEGGETAPDVRRARILLAELA